MNILFAFENPLPDTAADAEVFVTTARYLAPLASRAWFHVPAGGGSDTRAIEALTGMTVLPAIAPLRPAVLRHLCCGLTLPGRRAFRDADLVYTRNLWVAWMAMLSGRRVVFDHYRPWPDQIPPLQFWLYRLACSARLLTVICHSEYTRRAYLALGVPAAKVVCVHNGFEPARLRDPLPREAAKLALGIPPDRRTVVYTGRLNHKKGLELALQAAARLPELLFLLVGSQGEGPIEAMAAGLPNVRVVGWQAEGALAGYVQAADVLLIPPSWRPLAEFGSTVLPLKLFFYLASGRAILAGDTDDVREVLTHRRNAWLCRPDDVAALVAGLTELTTDAALAATLAASALQDSSGLTWQARALRIHEVIAGRLAAPPAGPGAWGRAQTRRWAGQSWRWLLHLLRRRSWVLPPRPARVPACSGPRLRR